jgi:hypothetical protein
VISATFQLKATNTTACDLFGQIEFGIESHTLPLSGVVIRYGIVTAEVSFSIQGGTSERSSWFCDQVLGKPIQATVTDASDLELETAKTTGSKAGISEKGLGLEDTSGKHKKTKTTTKTAVQYKTSLINVRAVGSSANPIWHFVPQPGADYLAGYLPPDGTRLMRVASSQQASTIQIVASSYFEYALVSLTGKKSKANAAIVAQAIWHKHFRAKRRTKKLSALTLPKT